MAHAAELRKPCPEMPSGAWGSLHGGSRKWFPEQPADPSLHKRVRGVPGGLPETHPPPDGCDSRHSGRPGTVTVTRVNSAGDARVLVRLSDTGWSLAACSSA